LLLRQLDFSEAIAGVSSIIFTICTTFLSYAQSNQHNNQILLLVVLGYATTLLALKLNKIFWLIISGLSLGFAIMIRSTSSLYFITCLGFLIGCYIYKKSAWKDTIKSSLIWIFSTIHFIILARLLNYFRFGTFSGSGQTLIIKQIKEHPFFQEIFKDLPPLPDNYPFINPAYEGIIGVLFTPAKSVFIYDPMLLICLILTYTQWHRMSAYLKLYLISVLFNIVLFLVVLSKFDFWHGDAAWGARYHLTSIHLFLIPLLAIFLEHLIFNPQSSKVYKNLAIALLILSFYVQMVSLVFRGSTETSRIYFAEFNEFNEFRLATRVENILCINRIINTSKCQQKLAFQDYRNLRKRLALFPFTFTKSRGLAFATWIIIFILAIISTLRFWITYVP
jgi:hypothetical protein